jgi:hypothetical protein
LHALYCGRRPCSSSPVNCLPQGGGLNCCMRRGREASLANN